MSNLSLLQIFLVTFGLLLKIFAADRKVYKAHKCCVFEFCIKTFYVFHVIILYQRWFLSFSYLSPLFCQTICLSSSLFIAGLWTVCHYFHTALKIYFLFLPDFVWMIYPLNQLKHSSSSHSPFQQCGSGFTTVWYLDPDSLNFGIWIRIH